MESGLVIVGESFVEGLDCWVGLLFVPVGGVGCEWVEENQWPGVLGLVLQVGDLVICHSGRRLAFFVFFLEELKEGEDKLTTSEVQENLVLGKYALPTSKGEHALQTCLERIPLTLVVG